MDSGGFCLTPVIIALSYVKQLLCAFLNFVYSMMPCNLCQVIFYVVGMLSELEMCLHIYTFN
jgi:hypothetical protein